jgi:hypothetical protein
MIFEAGKNNLREINIVMTKINDLRLEIEAIRQSRKKSLKNDVIRLAKGLKRQAKFKNANTTVLPNLNPMKKKGRLSKKSMNSLLNIDV